MESEKTDAGKERISLRRAPFIALLFALLALNSARAEQLPVKTYTTADGLAHDHILFIVRDSHGFLWFGTTDGLSRFDGTSFTSYGAKDGLASAFVNDMLESRSSVYWIGTNGGGVSRFNPYASQQPSIKGQSGNDAPRPLFDSYPLSDDQVSNRVNTLYEDRAGQIWVGTDGGLFRLITAENGVTSQRVEFGLQGEHDRLIEVFNLIEDREGSLWIATGQGLFRLLPGGRMIHYEIHPTEGIDYVWALLEDDHGRLWVGSRSGLMIVRPEPVAAIDSVGERPLWLMPDAGGKRSGANSQGEPLILPGEPGEARWYTTADGLTYNHVKALAQSADGHIWVATHRGGLTEFDGTRFRSYTKAQGVTERADALAFDSDGNLWVGSQSDGATRIARNGFLSYRETDGLGSLDVISSFEDREGNLCVVSDRWFINRFDGTRFTAIRPMLPKQITDSAAGRQEIIQDHAGEWWVATSAGLYRFPKVERLEDLARTKPSAIYTKRDGLADSNVSRLFEDSRGDLWISSYTPPLTLTRWERSTGRFHLYTETDGLPPLNWPNVFAEDAAGNLWLGLHNGGLARFRHDRFERFGAEDGVPEGLVQGLYRDRAGRLWVATREKGVGRIDEPAAEKPRVIRYSTTENLSSNNAECFTEDSWGRIYIGTARGVDRLDPSTGLVRHLTSGDGLVRNEIVAAFKDRHGALWFGSREGLSRLIPEVERPPSPPPILISRVLVDDRPLAISEMGEAEISGLVLEPNQNQIQIDFFGIDFSTSDRFNYQYMLEGADRNWSAMSDQRTVNYANLRPGNYRFLARATSANGVSSPQPATISFIIRPPVWQRWWFLTLAAILIGLAVFSLDRYRAARVRELDAALSESKKLTTELTSQRAELRQVNRTLELEFEVTRILAEAETGGEAAPRILQVICQHTGWDIGAIWHVDERDNSLRCAAVWHQPTIDAAEFEAMTRAHVFLPGEGLPGRVSESGQPLWLNDLAAEANLPRTTVAVKEGLRSAFGFPILLEGDVIGVIEFFSLEMRQPDEDLLQMMTTIGGQIGQLIDRKRTEEELRRTREERLVELERVRKRIATDLHDDIGSSLTQISILSEVVRQRINHDDAKVVEPLSMIANASRELVDSMSDIVWAINPQKDHLSDLTQRMRRFASDVFTARNIEFSFHAPGTERDVPLGANVRREVFLIFKESINNMVKHSGCARAEIEFQIEEDHLRLHLSDNGKGFSTAAESHGHGLMSMHERTLGLRGKLEVVSQNGAGTTIMLRIPLGTHPQPK
ncbi:MAG: two-component regulator propeller domain-containing protein [Pyrinomonadaceae bacterium]